MLAARSCNSSIRADVPGAARPPVVDVSEGRWAGVVPEVGGVAADRAANCCDKEVVCAEGCRVPVVVGAAE